MTWGVPVPWDHAHVFYVWYDALINYCTAIGYGDDDERFAAWWPAVHHLIGKDIVRFHCVWWPAMCMAAGIDPPARIARARLAAARWREDVQDRLAEGGIQIDQVAPDELTDDFGVDPVRYHLLRDTPLRPRRRLLLRGHRRPLQRRPGQQPRQPGGPGGHGGRLQVRRHRPVRPTRTAPSPRRRPRPSRLRPRPGSASRPHEALEATWRLIGAANAELEATEPWKLPTGARRRRGPGQRPRGPADRRPPDRPGHARRGRRDLAPPRARRVAPGDRRLPDDAAWGGYPGGLAVEKGAPLFPRRTRLTSAWFDSHCHVQDRYLSPDGAR